MILRKIEEKLSNSDTGKIDMCAYSDLEFRLQKEF